MARSSLVLALAAAVGTAAAHAPNDFVATFFASPACAAGAAGAYSVVLAQQQFCQQTHAGAASYEGESSRASSFSRPLAGSLTSPCLRPAALC